VTLARTPSQTVGPFFGFALDWPQGPFVVPQGTDDAVWLRGRLFDGQGAPVPDGMVETWQADPQGRLPGPDAAAPDFRGFGRCTTDARGSYAILTLKPGNIRGADGSVHAPHILVSVFARGLLKRAVTRIYFEDEQAANEADAVLMSIGSAAARATLLAARAEGGYLFDIRLQGEGETTFFDV
jgi:protocatechuate 3,4-dioxygenase, alpha subunit